MYVTTFYSYKGGVGRTLALVNVAYELAASGQKVLVVDFDLEAPAIHRDTWRRPKGRSSGEESRARPTHPGIVDYVGRFIETMRAPRAEDHIVDATPKDPTTGEPMIKGEIALMPSGELNEDYGKRLGAIDWNELYAKYDGYVMFEDLREQWRQLGYDYVLLDSRTGVTDVGGICTRHLPDSVVMMFRPDEQSLQGTAGIVDAIRNERPAPGRDRARLHFVMAGIPDADDEEGVLDELRERFQQRLSISGFRDYADRDDPYWDPPRDNPNLLEIRNYQSMDLLQQPVYTRWRPRTMLARSYQELTKRIRCVNLDDREGALQYVKRFGRHILDDGELDKFRQRHRNDPGVLGVLADAYHFASRTDEAVDLLEQVAELGTLSPRQILSLAEWRCETGDRRGSLRTLSGFFEGDHSLSRWFDGGALVRSALKQLETLGEDRAKYIESGSVMAGFGPLQRAWTACLLDRSRRERELQAKLLAAALDDGDGPPTERRSWARELASARVAVRQFARAVDYYRSTLAEESGRSVETAFNLAMASWGESGLADPEVFRRVLQRRDREHAARERYPHPERMWGLRAGHSRHRLREDAHEEGANPTYLQAMALAEYFTGRQEKAGCLLQEARQIPSADVDFGYGSALSCWSFTRVSADTFLEHCDEIRRLFDGEDVKPVFMRDAEEG